MSKNFMAGTHWTPEQIEVLKNTPINRPFMMNRIQAPVLFSAITDRGTGYTFIQREWNDARRAGERGLKSDAAGHRLEAVRRMAVCRLEGRIDESESWRSWAAWFTSVFSLPELKDGDS